MTQKARTIAGGVSHLEECLLNLKALVKFGLHATETSTHEEFGKMRDEWNTMMYLLQDNIETAYSVNGDIEVIERTARGSKEARH